MNKFTLQIFLLLVIGFSLQAQEDYVPMFGEENAGWYQYADLSEAGGKTTLKIYTAGDTTVGGQTYVKLMNDWYYASEDTTYTQLIGFFREVASERKVYSLNSPTAIEPETVYYDFSKDVGDTIRLGSDGNTLLVVDSINNTVVVCDEIIEVESRVFHLSNVDDEDASIVWIEGVGSIAGLQAYYYGVDCGSLDEALICKMSDDNILYHFNGIEGFEECDFEVETSNQQLPEELSLKIFPNPVQAELRVAGDPSELGHARYRIFNLTGKLMKTGTLDYNRETTLDVSSLQAGAYFIEIYNADKNLLTNKKFIVAR
ncbi:MAG TPA: T9SS type A sorting domain-containing protein [Membranihabitans sp.]|nr:T9SS type A sorting domain-containing protein [Membranihabitans sp.]